MLASLSEHDITALFSKDGLTFVDNLDKAYTIYFKTAETTDRLFVEVHAKESFSYFSFEYREQGDKSAIVTREAYQKVDEPHKILEPKIRLTFLEKRTSDLFEMHLLAKKEVLAGEPIQPAFELDGKIIEFINTTKISFKEEVKSFFDGTILDGIYQYLEPEAQIRFETNFQMLPEELRGPIKELLVELNKYEKLKDGLKDLFQASLLFDSGQKKTTEGFQESRKEIINLFKGFIEQGVVPFISPQIGQHVQALNATLSELEQARSQHEEQEKALEERDQQLNSLQEELDAKDLRLNNRHGQAVLLEAQCQAREDSLTEREQAVAKRENSSSFCWNATVLACTISTTTLLVAQILATIGSMSLDHQEL